MGADNRLKAAVKALDEAEASAAEAAWCPRCKRALTMNVDRAEARVLAESRRLARQTKARRKGA